MDEGVPDAALYEALRLGSGRAMRLLADRHDPAMRRVALLYVPPGDPVDALVRRTWTTALPGLDMFTWHTTFRVWLYGILVTGGRGVAVRPPPTPPTPMAAAAAGPLPWETLPWSRCGADAVSASAGAMTRMALREREVLWFRHAEGWPDREVCDVLGLTAEQFNSLSSGATSGLLAVVAQHLAAPTPEPAVHEAAATALLTALMPDAGRTPDTDLDRALRRWRADRGLTLWHRARARWRLRERAAHHAREATS